MLGWEWLKSLQQSLYYYCCLKPHAGSDDRSAVGRADEQTEEESVPFLSKSGSHTNQQETSLNDIRARFQRANTCTALLPAGGSAGAVEFWVPRIQSVQPSDITISGIPDDISLLTWSCLQPGKITPYHAYSQREVYFDKTSYAGDDSGCSTPVSAPAPRRYTMPSNPNYNLRKKYKPQQRGSHVQLELEPQLYSPNATTKDGDEHSPSLKWPENLGNLVYNISNDGNSGKLKVHIDKIEGLPSVSTLMAYSLVIRHHPECRLFDTIEPLTISDNTILVNKTYIMSEGMELELSLSDVECEDCLLLHGYCIIRAAQPDGVTNQRTATLTRNAQNPCGAKVLVKGEYNKQSQNLYITVSKVDLRSRLNYFIDKYVYVKATVYYKYKKIRSFKTHGFVVQQGTSIYSLQKQFNFVLSSASLNEVILVISLLERSLLRQDIVLGREILGPYIESSERTPTVWGRFALSEFAIDHWCIL